MTFGLILIGDELLTGKRSDKHLPRVIDMLARRGLELAWCRIVGDDIERIAAALGQAEQANDVVLCCGGIGATPDDVTRQAAAQASGRPLEVHAEAKGLLEARIGERLYPYRIRMVEWPRGAELIPNPVNQVSGFSLNHWHFVPGFPRMAWPMLEWVLDTHYQALQREPAVEYRLKVWETPESELVPLLEGFGRRYPMLRFSCLPNSDGELSLELGVRGPAGTGAKAYDEMKQALIDGGRRIEELT